MEDNYLDDFDLSDDFYEDIELTYNVVYVKFSKYSKLYAYLIEESVEVGQMVWVKDKNEPLEVIKVAELKESELPVPFEKMKYATINRPFENHLLEILNIMLPRMEMFIHSLLNLI